MNRSEFLAICLRPCAGAIGMAWLIQGCSAYYYAQYSVADGQVTVLKREFAHEKNGQVYLRRFVLVKAPGLDFPICVYRMDEDDFVALYTRCMHQGCEVKPQDDYLVCPCHGSEYDNTGKVTNPPADKDLLRFKVTTDLEAVHIALHA